MNNQDQSKIIVSFHTGRGGRFFNAGHKEYIGEMDFQDVLRRETNRLFEQNRDKQGRFTKRYITDCDGNVLLRADEVDKLTGLLDFDGDYDTYTSHYLEDCTDEELALIAESSEYKSPELEEYLKENLVIE